MPWRVVVRCALGSAHRRERRRRWGWGWAEGCLLGPFGATRPLEYPLAAHGDVLHLYELRAEILERLVVELELSLQPPQRDATLLLQVGPGTDDGVKEAQGSALLDFAYIVPGPALRSAT